MIAQGIRTKGHLNQGPVGTKVPSGEWDFMNSRKCTSHPPLHTTATTTTNNSKALLEFFTQRKQLLTIFFKGLLGVSPV